MRLFQPFVRGGIYFKIDDLILYTDKISMVVPVDAHSDPSGMTHVHGVDQISDLFPIRDTPNFTLETLVAEKHARERRVLQSFRKPFHFFRRDDRNSISTVLKIVSIRVVRKRSVLVLKIIGVQNHKAEPVPIKEVESFLHPVGFESRLAGAAVKIMVSRRMATRYLEIIEKVNKFSFFLRIMAKIAAMNDEIALFADGPILDLNQMIRRSAHKNSGIVVKVSKNTEFHGVFSCRFLSGNGRTKGNGKRSTGTRSQETAAIYGSGTLHEKILSVYIKRDGGNG